MPPWCAAAAVPLRAKIPHLAGDCFADRGNVRQNNPRGDGGESPARRRVDERCGMDGIVAAEVRRCSSLTRLDTSARRSQVSCLGPTEQKQRRAAPGAAADTPGHPDGAGATPPDVDVCATGPKGAVGVSSNPASTSSSLSDKAGADVQPTPGFCFPRDAGPSAPLPRDAQCRRSRADARDLPCDGCGADRRRRSSTRSWRGAGSWRRAGRDPHSCSRRHVIRAAVVRSVSESGGDRRRDRTPRAA